MIAQVGYARALVRQALDGTSCRPCPTARTRLPAEACETMAAGSRELTAAIYGPPWSRRNTGSIRRTLLVADWKSPWADELCIARVQVGEGGVEVAFPPSQGGGADGRRLHRWGAAQVPIWGPVGDQDGRRGSLVRRLLRSAPGFRPPRPSGSSRRANAADKAVRSTFGVLASHWSYLLDQPDLTALAWEELVLHSQSRRSPLLGVATDDPLQYDALVLTDLGLGRRAIADITGQYVGTIRYRIAPHTLHTDNLLPARNR